ncbi:pirin family protein [Citricoccus nitrophenolicus]|uniref:pirin family protein n=1 Tax=Citricoccus nitrophenolicus TaxID=863575 RepID=UPI0031EFE256
MSNTETDPRETLCQNDPAAVPRFTEGLSDGVDPREGAAGPVELLEPRAVPLGGPRAMTVRRTLPQRARSLIGAWCFLDFYGPDDVSTTGGMAVPRHPHTGLATVSWLFTGRVDHVDSAGNWATVRPGEVNLMNAGAGITHSEFSTADTTVLHGAQLWYAFPDHARFGPPSLEAHRPETVTGPGYTARVFLGSLLGSTSPVKTHIPLTGVELLLEPGASVVIDVPADHEHGLLQVSGEIWLDGVQVPEDHLGFAGPGRTRITVAAGEEAVTALLIGGEPLNEQIVMWWNFVGRTHEEIVAWRDAYQAEMGFEVPGEDSPLAGAVPTEAPGGDPLGAPVSGDLLDRTLGTSYRDGRAFPQYGHFPAGTPAPLPAPALPTTRMKPRANPPTT